MSSNANPEQQICVVGSANVDLTFRTSRLPVPGETLAGQSLHRCMGGKGANQAVAAARLGASVTFVARVGNDSFGAEAIKAYETEGIQTQFIQQDETEPTGTAAILVDDDAENCIVVVAGANANLTPNDVRDASSVIRQSRVVLCQLETPVEAAVEAFQIAREAGAITVLTPAPANQVTDELLKLCDVCVPNRTEVAMISGEEVSNLASATKATASLLDRGVKAVALTLGSEGVLLVDDAGSTRIPASEVRAVDTTGAGDAFSGALAVYLAGGMTLADAARRAAKVAAISVTRLGTQTSFPTLHEVNRWPAGKEDE